MLNFVYLRLEPAETSTGEEQLTSLCFPFTVQFQHIRAEFLTKGTFKQNFKLKLFPVGWADFLNTGLTIFLVF